ncbi:NAD(P)-binding protein [Hesseltinella vesiculosa]|uniref:enoyl-[acyl-carrier-protein] reductase n=1 Tax=Hesseltinella vesiculosa TaxID=101127 RepID=A0A1X2G3I9_9FUNG|nr:NAD(P)-binding protein [Hesseltinella vesiculosa]
MISMRPFGITRRAYSTSNITVDALVYGSYGKPSDVLKWHSYKLPALTANTLHVKFLASPINPADVNQVQGAYPFKPPFRSLGDQDSTPYAVGGNEGVAEVIAVGDQVQGIQVGDHVLPNPGFGTWRNFASGAANDFQVLPKRKNVSIIQEATLSVNPCTAYRMLKDFVPLQPGDYVIQNGANSAVGQSVIQLAKAWGLNTINVIRDRPNLDELKQSLEQLGATHVLTEEMLRSHDTKTLIKQWGSPKLGLNCVGGKAATEMARHLKANGQYVTYGAMARAPLALPASLLIFKNLSFHGFWMTRWTDTHNAQERATMVEDLLDLMDQDKLNEVAWTRVNWEAKDVVTAVEQGIQGYGSGKQIILFD